MVTMRSMIRIMVCGAALTGAMPALASPVTDADIRGKKICWNNGSNNTYNKDGSLDSNRMGHGTWQLSGDLISLIGSNGSSALTISKEGETFHATRKTRNPANGVEIWGNYSN